MNSREKARKPDQSSRIESPDPVELSPVSESGETSPFNPGDTLTRAKVLQLQRTIGNQAVQRLIENARQLKSTLSGPGQMKVREIQRAQVAADRGNGYGTLENAEETFGTGGGKRQTALEGFVKPDRYVRETGQNAAPLSFVTTGVDNKNMPAELRGYDRGHIMAVASSGPNVSNNVVPQHPRVNGSGNWKKFEGQTLSVANEVAGRADNKDKKYGVFVKITISYANTTSRIPSSFGVKAELQERTVPPKGKKRKVSGKAKAKPLHGNTLNALRNKLAAVTFDGIDNKGIALTPAQIQVRQDALKKARTDAKGKPPVSTATLGPLPPADYRPYGALEGTLPGFTPSQSKYKKDQIQMILAYNIKKNGGLLSDAPNDRYPVLKEHGKMSRPEIDHIVPETNGGFNAFSNARVVSKWLNRHKEKVVSAEDKKKRLKKTYDPLKDTKYKARKTGVHGREFGFRGTLTSERTRYEALKKDLQALFGTIPGDKYKPISTELKRVHTLNVTEINRRYLQAVAVKGAFDSKTVTALAVTNFNPVKNAIESFNTVMVDSDEDESESIEEDDSSEDGDSSSEDSSSEEEDDFSDEDSSEEDLDDSSEESSSEEDEEIPPPKRIKVITKKSDKK